MKLKAPKKIMGVQLAKRTECCAEQSRNVKVQVGAGLRYDENDPVCKVISQLNGNGLMAYCCDNVHEGQYVILSNDQKYLTVCEATVLVQEALNPGIVIYIY